MALRGGKKCNKLNFCREQAKCVQNRYHNFLHFSPWRLFENSRWRPTLFVYTTACLVWSIKTVLNHIARRLNPLNTSKFVKEYDFIVKNMMLGSFQDGRRGSGKLAAILNSAQNHFSTIPTCSMENLDLNSGFKVLNTPFNTEVIAS